MNTILITFLAGIGLSIVTVFADTLIKNASLHKGLSGLPELLWGALIYGLTAFGWFFLVQRMKLSTIGVLYGVSCVVLLTLVSVFYFKEKINLIEIFGIALAIISLVILSRFA